MAGGNGSVRGKSKIETYLRYVETAEANGDWSSIPDARHKKACEKAMTWDPDVEEWVLHFHLHS